MAHVTPSHFRCRIASDPASVEAAQRLRHAVFFGTPGRDQDQHDRDCDHVLVERCTDAQVVGTVRYQVFENGAGLARGYSAQRYDLSRLAAYPEPILELGRFCTDTSINGPTVLRLILGALGRVVAENNAGLMIGCSSFAGICPAPYQNALRVLSANHQAPTGWRPGAKADQILALSQWPEECDIDYGKARDEFPPLLRTYLNLGGWVSDHAVIDPHFETLHVFTAVEVAKIPEHRLDKLMSLARATDLHLA